MKAPTPPQKQAIADMLGLQAEQRFKVRREAARKRASARSDNPAHGLAAQPRFADARSRAHLPSPAALAVVCVALAAAALFGLAFLGALTLVHGVFGQ